MNVVAKVASLPELILGAFLAACPFLLLAVLGWWLIRLITSLRDRLDAIEDKLELLLLAEQLKGAHQSPAAGMSSPSQTP